MTELRSGIVRLHEQGYSVMQTVTMISCGHSTVSRAIKRFEETRRSLAAIIIDTIKSNHEFLGCSAQFHNQHPKSRKFPAAAILKNQNFVSNQLGKRGSVYVSLKGLFFDDKSSFLVEFRTIISQYYHSMAYIDNAIKQIISNPTTDQLDRNSLKKRRKKFRSYSDDDAEAIGKLIF
uniref:Transposase n=1 Tax=Ditylenchus dipsaci TaxID=166011 RepID=A0A915CWR5_9BILA